eukprot:scaffold1832_cov362-Prasinococcus_capsulatus_cf.AAC.7
MMHTAATPDGADGVDGVDGWIGPRGSGRVRTMGSASLATPGRLPPRVPPRRGSERASWMAGGGRWRAAPARHRRGARGTATVSCAVAGGTRAVARLHECLAGGGRGESHATPCLWPAARLRRTIVLQRDTRGRATVHPDGSGTAALADGSAPVTDGARRRCGRNHHRCGQTLAEGAPLCPLALAAVSRCRAPRCPRRVSLCRTRWRTCIANSARKTQSRYGAWICHRPRKPSAHWLP